MGHFTSFEQACEYLFALERVENTGIDTIEMKLDKMRQLLQELGNPQKNYRTVHVAGTNGKGSTCSFLSALLSTSGLKTGLHTSPHLFSFAERMKINGQAAEEDWIVDASNRMSPIIDRLGPSFFEVSTAMSFLYFSEMEVDIAVIEVGLGGRLDATNVILPELSIITQIDFDHKGKLGNTKEEIAFEKAGIIKPGVPIIIGDKDPRVLDTVRKIAEERQSTFLQLHDLLEIEFSNGSFAFTFKSRKFNEVKLGLNGQHQSLNAGLALAASQLLLGDLDYSLILEALTDVKRIAGIRARCEVLSEEPFVVADVAHNPQGFKAGIDWFLSSAPKDGEKYVLFGVSEDKDYEDMLVCLKGLDVKVVPVRAPVKRGLDVKHISTLLMKHEIDSVSFGENVSEAVNKILKLSSTGDSLYIGGSHYVVGELLDLFFDRI